jgi:hypothetical protein
MSFKIPQVIAELTLLSILLVFAAYLRLHNVTDNPGWYTDETTHIDIARHLQNGEMRYMVINDSTLLFARLPLFYLLLALNLSDVEAITTLRTLTGSLGVLSVLLLYLILRRSGDAILALIAAAALTAYPQAILYSRFGFSYNLLAPLLLLMWFGLGAFAQTRRVFWLIPAALALGLGTVTDVFAFLLIPAFVMVVLVARRPLYLLWSLPLLAVPFGIYSFIMLSRAPDAFLYDLSYTLSRTSPISTLDGQIANLAHNYQILLNQDLWFVAGIVGLFLLKPAALRWTALLLFWLPLIAIGRAYALYSLSAYYLIPLLPFVALGVAALIRFGGMHIWRVMYYVLLRRDVAQIEDIGATQVIFVIDDDEGLLPRMGRLVAGGVATLVTGLAILLLIGSPLEPGIRASIDMVENGYTTDIDPFLMNPADARAVAAFINANTDSTDSVIVSPVAGWLFETNVTDFQVTAAAETGAATPHLPANLPPERFIFDPSHTAARYVVTDPTWYNWGLPHVPGVPEILADVETWERVFEAGDLVVWQNPDR